MKTSNPFARFFGVILRAQTYLNLIYLLLVFPLSLVYLLFFTIGGALGLALMIVLVGFLILAVVCLGWWAIATFERYLAIWLLNVDVPPLDKAGLKNTGTGGWIMDLITNPVTWTSLLYILIRFPLGIFTLFILVLFGATSIALICAPFLYWWVPIEVSISRNWQFAIDTLPEALAACVVGIFLGFISLHIFNLLAQAFGLLAKLMLGNEPAAPGIVQPALPPQPVESPSSLKVTAPLAAAPAPESLESPSEVIETSDLPGEVQAGPTLMEAGETAADLPGFLEFEPEPEELPDETDVSVGGDEPSSN